MQSGGQAGRVGAAAARWRTAPSKAELMRTHTLTIILYSVVSSCVCVYIFQLETMSVEERRFVCAGENSLSVRARYR